MKNNNKNLFLPEELILEILMRLPVKYLIRFRCVSKSRFSLINNPQFAKMHFEKVDIPTDRLIHLTEERSMKAKSIDLEASLNDDCAIVKLNPQFPTPYFGLTIKGSCRGFILLSHHPKHFIIWNPSTNVHRIISYSPIARDVQRDIHGSIYKTLAYGFGYHAAIDDYLVVIVSLDVADNVTHLELFSVRANSWKEIKGIHFPYLSFVAKDGLFFNEAIHWICRSPGVIIMFDWIQRNFSEIHLPNGFINNCFNRLKVLGGCLSLCSWSWVQKTEIWVMKEYKVESSWTKVFVLPIHEALPTYFSPLCFTKYGEVVGLYGTKKIVKLNDKAELLEERTYLECQRALKGAMYTESLLSLPSDFGEANEDDQ